MTWAPARKDFDAAYIRSRVSYNPETGDFFWLERPVSHFKNCSKSAAHLAAMWNATHAHKRADKKDGEYKKIVINKIAYKAHRIAYLYVTGKWPDEYIDHKNRIKSDNRFCNIRQSSASENRFNTAPPANNTSGIKGVYWDKKLCKWKAAIKIKRKIFHLGYYDEKTEAVNARIKASANFYGDFSPHDAPLNK